jgi:hypothetical protein
MICPRTKNEKENRHITAPNQNWRLIGKLKCIASYHHLWFFKVLCFVIANFG